MDGSRIEYEPLIGFTHELFCVERPLHTGNGTYLTHFFPSRKAYAVCGVRETDAIRVRLTVVEDTGAALYYGWYDAKDQRLSMVFHARKLVEMCFPYGSRAEENCGRGRLVALHVERSCKESP